ncbi:TfoX/Sxy family protein [Microbacterium sp. JZ70]|nr:TfoX/Sxy family protein [Microbacterium barkeri]MDI6944911.1 TfoX/Sxy family protein [Microbacterium barkeri]MDR6877839.1 TfoX/Sxy family transcriptional regulator of competence genes [Microbacterium barkeri]
MAYDDELADRIRAFVPADAVEIRMFGGLCWTLRGHMVAGITRDELMIPVGRDGMADALARGAHEMQMGTRTMTGFAGVRSPTDEQLDEWIRESVARTLALPPKEKKAPR